MGKFKGIVYLTEQQYAEMYNNKTLDEDTQYVTDQEPVYSTYEVDAIAKSLQDQITTATGGEFTKVLVGGVYQPLFDADTKANADDIPTKTSDLTNDSGFITEEDIPTIPTKTSQLTNDSGFLKEIPSEYVTETELTNKSFAKQSDLDTTNSKVQENANAISDINSSLSSKADKAALDTVSNNVTTIQGKIPTQASATNQLADKAFVNSSISTATATFRGTVDSVDSLPTTGVDINDYAFVRATDSAGNTLYQRYKYNGSQWAFEYELNNSSFTSEQWATINSGLTKDYVDSADLNTISTIIAEVENLLKDKADNSAIPTSLSQLASDSTHRTVTDDEKTTWNNKSNFSGSYNDLTDKPTTAEDLENVINNTTVIGDATKGLRIGESSSVKDSSSTAIGHSAFADGSNSTALGNSATADSGDFGGEAYGEYSTAIGEFANANQHSVAVGKGSNAWQDSVAIGYNAVAARETIGDITDPAKIIQIGEGTNNTPNTVQFFDDNIYNHSTHTLTVQNIALNGEDILNKIPDTSALENRIGAVETKNTEQDTEISGKVSKSGDTMTGSLAVNSEMRNIETTSTLSASFAQGTFASSQPVRLQIEGLKANATSTYVSGYVDWQFTALDFDESFSGYLPLTLTFTPSDGTHGSFTFELRNITEDGILEVYAANDGIDGSPLSLNFSTIRQTLSSTADISTNTISTNTIVIQNETPTSDNEATRKDYVDSEILKVQNKIPDVSSFITSSALPSYMKKYFGYTTPTRQTLFNGNAGSGNITLIDSWQNYDMLQVQMAWDAGTNMTSAYYPTWILKTALSEQSAESKDGVMLCPGENYWSIKTTSTGTTLYVSAENGMIRNIYGINFT